LGTSSNDPSTLKGVFYLIHNLAEQKENLTLTSTLRGLDHDQRATIIKIQNEQVYLKIDDYRIFSFPGVGSNIFLRHPSFSRPIQASCQNPCWLNDGVLILTNLAYKDTEWVERIQDRVQPKWPLYVNFRYRRKVFRGDVENIAVSGLGMIVDRFFEKEIDLAVSKKIVLNFSLPPNFEIENLPGSIMNVQSISKNLMRLGIRIRPRFSDLGCLMAYVNQRKAEIMYELDQVSIDSYEPEDVFGLYF
jgi:hypothetical protein